MIYGVCVLVGTYVGGMACRAFDFYGLEAIAACVCISSFLAAVAKFTE